MDRREFERIARKALNSLPKIFKPYVEGCILVVKARPSEELLRQMGIGEDEELFGLYEGPSLLDRRADDPPELPPRITLFYEPLIGACETREELEREIQRTIVHEAGHFFGLDEDRLAELGFE